MLNQYWVITGRKKGSLLLLFFFQGGGGEAKGKRRRGMERETGEEKNSTGRWRMERRYG